MVDDYPRDWKPIYTGRRTAEARLFEKVTPNHEQVKAARVALAESLRRRRRNDRIMTAAAILFVIASASCAYMVVF